MKIILVVDDVEPIRELLRIILEAEYEVLQAATGSEALAIAHREGVALVILDLYLEGSILTGLNTLEVMKSTPEIYHIPVLVISGYATPNEIQQAMALGAAKFVAKPYSPTHLLASVEELIGPA